MFTKPGQIVLDPFLGSGTTAAAASLLDRKYIGVEILPEYKKHIKKALSEVKSLKNGRSRKKH